jgi:hypothetical protein
MEYQDWVNELATAARKLFVEQVAAVGFMMALASNGKVATAENTKVYTNALNDALAECYAIMRNMGIRVGKPPKRTFDAEKRCTDSCKNARGYHCVCACAGLFHRSNIIGTMKKEKVA